MKLNMSWHMKGFDRIVRAWLKLWRAFTMLWRSWPKFPSSPSFCFSSAFPPTSATTRRGSLSRQRRWTCKNWNYPQWQYAQGVFHFSKEWCHGTLTHHDHNYSINASNTNSGWNFLFYEWGEGREKVSIVFSPFQCEEGTFLRGPGASGWRVGEPESKFWDVLRHQCADYTEDKTEVSHFLNSWNFSHQRCVRETTFNLSELVDDAWLENPVKPTGEKPNIMVDQLWRPDFTLTWYWLRA